MDELTRRPDEASISEGNLVENPLFVLNNKDAKPKDKADYVKTIQLGTIIVGSRAIERSIKLHASTEYGFPTAFAYRILLALIDQCRQAGFVSPRVYTSRHKLAKAVGIKKPSKKEYDDIENACNAMGAMFIQFRGAWYDKASKAKAQDKDSVHLIERVHFRDERQASLPGIGDEGGDSGSVTLGVALFESLKAGYYNGVDLQYLNALNRSPLAQLLYAYLTKKDAGKRMLTRSLKELGQRFALKKRVPSALYEAFAPALDLLSQPLKVGEKGVPRQFLERWDYDKEKGQVTIWFFKASEDGKAVAPGNGDEE